MVDQANTIVTKGAFMMEEELCLFVTNATVFILNLAS